MVPLAISEASSAMLLQYFSRAREAAIAVWLPIWETAPYWKTTNGSQHFSGVRVVVTAMWLPFWETSEGSQSNLIQSNTA